MVYQLKYELLGNICLSVSLESHTHSVQESRNKARTLGARELFDPNGDSSRKLKLQKQFTVGTGYQPVMKVLTL